VNTGLLFLRKNIYLSGGTVVKMDVNIAHTGLIKTKDVFIKRKATEFD